MASGDSPSNAAIAAMGGGGGGGGQWPWIFLFIKYVLLESPLLEPHISSKAESLLVYKIFLENPPSGASYFLWPNI